ncbi:hypothetical protein NCHU2750_22370 [Neorhizobium sp. NCHU2750]|nr:hypothetical protein NCHU2750_22370 [Neorhizobium sp. NCHU2750]
MTRQVTGLITSVCFALAMWAALGFASLLMWKFIRDVSG